MQEYLTEPQQSLEYFMNDGGSKIPDNEDIDPDYEPEDNISGIKCFY